MQTKITTRPLKQHERYGLAGASPTARIAYVNIDGVTITIVIDEDGINFINDDGDECSLKSNHPSTIEG